VLVAAVAVTSDRSRSPYLCKDNHSTPTARKTCSRPHVPIVVHPCATRSSEGWDGNSLEHLHASAACIQHVQSGTEDSKGDWELKLAVVVPLAAPHTKQRAVSGREHTHPMI